MKFVSWNVNGIRPAVQKGLWISFRADADIFCIQESKMQEGHWNWRLLAIISTGITQRRKGYSGTAIFTKARTISVSYGIGIEEHDQEGRVIT